MRVVVDASVLVSAVISAAGPPREILTAWVDGRFELITSPALLDEFHDVLEHPKLRRWVSAATAAELIAGLREDALIVADPARAARSHARPRRRLPGRAGARRWRRLPGLR